MRWTGSDEKESTPKPSSDRGKERERERERERTAATDGFVVRRVGKRASPADNNNQSSDREKGRVLLRRSWTS
jgi:hypothetical protein